MLGEKKTLLYLQSLFMQHSSQALIKKMLLNFQITQVWLCTQTPQNSYFLVFLPFFFYFLATVLTTLISISNTVIFIVLQKWFSSKFTKNLRLFYLENNKKSIISLKICTWKKYRIIWQMVGEKSKSLVCRKKLPILSEDCRKNSNFSKDSG